MKNYKTSKDYKRLKELLDSGYKVICLVGGHLSWFAYFCGEYIYSQGHLPKEITDDEFREVCEFDKIEFIDPIEDSDDDEYEGGAVIDEKL